MSIPRLSVAAAIAVLAASPSALAQTQVFRSVTAPQGKVTRLLVMPALKKDCSPGPLGEIRVVTAPKNGALAVEKGKLKTPASYRCPNVEAQVQGAVYRPNPKYTGPDEVVLETKTPDGETQRTTIRITVSDKPAESGKKESTDL